MTVLDPFAIPLSGNRLIEAGAGTGKTYTIASLFLRLVLSGRPVREILVVTFTEAATAELKDRLRLRLRDAFDAFAAGSGGEDPFLCRMLEEVPSEEHPRARRLLMTALGGFDEAAVFTIHGFCLRVLRENAFESGVMFDAELSRDPAPVYRDIAADFWALGTYALPGAWVRYLEKRRIDVDALAALLARVAGHPDRQVLPHPEDASGDVALFQEHYRHAREIWLRERDEIAAIFQVHPGINRRSYSKKNLPRWLRALDAYFETAEAKSLHGDGILERFTQSRLTKMAAELKGAPAPPRHPFFERCDRICGLGERWRVQFLRRFVDFGLAALSKRKAELGIRFFDDLIQDLDRALFTTEGPHLAGRIRRRYPVALIDEFQDTDLTQYRIFRAIYRQETIPFFMIGDPKQSIYAFRGADVFAYLRAAEDAGERTHTLTVNWRSDPSLIRAVNTIFDTGDGVRPFGMPEIGFHPAEAREGAVDAFTVSGDRAAPFAFLYVRGPGTNSDEAGPGGSGISRGWADENLPDRTAADICRLLADGAVLREGASRPLEPGDIAVLVRTNRQGRLMQAALRGKALPTVLTSQESVFDSCEATELHHILRAVAAPPADTAMFTAMATDLMGVSGSRIDAMRAGDPEWAWWVDRFREWHRTWVADGFIQMMARIFTTRAPGRAGGFLMDLLSPVDGERRVTNFQHLAELLQTAARRENLGPAGLMRWLERQRAGEGEASEAHELRLESDERAVRIVTIHKSKGLEYPVVYLPFLWDGAMRNADKPPAECHLPHEGNRPVIDLGSDDLPAHLALAAREQTMENLRLLYVALTRARHACRVVWGAIKQVENSALAYLIHRPEGDGIPDFPLVAGHAAALEDAGVLSDLTRLADRSEDCIDIKDLIPDADARYSPPAESLPVLTCRHAERLLRRQWRMESFSRLVAEAFHDATPEEDLGLDYDQRVQGGGSDPAPLAAAPPGGDATVPLATFSRGADAGTFFHAIYEHLDFAETDPKIILATVSEKLSAYGFDAGEWKGLVGKAISGTLDCPLDPDRTGLSLRRISTAKRLNELAFVFPAEGRHTGETDPITPSRIGRIFDNHASAAVPVDYGKSVGALGFSAIRGYVKGFMDLVFEYEGRWYLVDYKSNHLGDNFGDYGPEALTRAMAAHHYFLQYHIYLAALHRYLSYRLPDYDYDRHFGGVYYLFIRGMSPEIGSGFGVFRDRPGKGMVATLSGAFGEGGKV